MNSDSIRNLVAHVGVTPGCESDHGPGSYHATFRGTIAKNTLICERRIQLWHTACRKYLRKCGDNNAYANSESN